MTTTLGNITENKNETIISSNITEMNAIDFFKREGHKIMPLPLELVMIKGKLEKKQRGWKKKWPLYKRKDTKGKDTWFPAAAEFTGSKKIKALSDEELEARQQYWNDTEFGVVDTSRFPIIDKDSPDCDDWLVELEKTAPYSKSLTKSFGRHIFCGKYEKFMKCGNGTLEDKKSLKCPKVEDCKKLGYWDTERNQCRHHGEGKIEIMHGKWIYFRKSDIIKNCHNKMPTDIDLKRLSGNDGMTGLGQFLQKKENDDSKNEGLILPSNCLKPAIPVITKRQKIKLLEYTALIADKYWTNHDTWRKIKCTWKSLGATFDDFQKECVKPNRGNIDNNKKLWENDDTFMGWRPIYDLCKRSNEKKKNVLDAKWGSFLKFDKYTFRDMCDYKTNQEALKIDQEITDSKKERKELQKDLMDCCKKNALKKIQRKLEKIKVKITDLEDLFLTAYNAHIAANYILKKEYFEEFHFKVIDPICYARKRYTDFCLYNKAQFQEVYQYLKVQKRVLGILKPVSFIKVWLDDITILEYNSVDFLPPPLQIPDETHNLFIGLAAENLVGAEGSTDIQIFLDHLKLLGGKEKSINGLDPYTYLLNYHADMIQYPGRKPEVGILCRGAQGTGKTGWFKEFGMKVLGNEYFLISPRIDDFIGRFCLLNHKILAVLEEAAGSDTFSTNGKIKDMITSDRVKFEEKCKGVQKLRCVVRPIYLSNGLTPLPIEIGDRRIVAVTCSDDKKGNKEYFEKLFAAFENPSQVFAFHQYLKNNVDLSNFNAARDRCLTRTYYDIQSVNISIYLRFLSWRCRVGNCGLEEATMKFTIRAEKLFEEFGSWISCNKPANKEKTNSTSMGRWLGKYGRGIIGKKMKTGKEYIIDPIKIRKDCECFDEFLY